MDPRNTARTTPAAVDWAAPDAEETSRIHRAIDTHKAGRVDLSTSEEGCAIANDTSGVYEIVTLGCPEDEAVITDAAAAYIHTERCPIGWQAITDDYDGAPDAGWPSNCIGYGKTEAEAIADLHDQMEAAA